MARTLLQTVDGVAHLRFDHPPVNVLTTAMLDDMARALEKLRDVRLLLIRGLGRSFSAGMDVREHLPADVPAMLRAVRRFFQAVWQVDCPVVAAVHGAALGGAAELLLLCDFVFMHREATLGFPEIKVGAYPPLATVVLPRVLTWQRAVALILQGRLLSAEEAQDWGLATGLYADEENLTHHLERIQQLSPAVQRLALRAMRVGDDLFERLAEVERQYVDELMRTDDAREGVLAFLGKRAPRWNGRSARPARSDE